VDVWDHTSSGDGRLDEGVKLLVTSDRELQMSWGDSLHLEVLRGVTGELQNLSGQVLENGSAVNGGGGSDSAVGAHSALQNSVDSSDWELKTGLG